MRRVRSLLPMTTLPELDADEATWKCRAHRGHEHPTHREPSVAEQPVSREKDRVHGQCKSPPVPCARLYCLFLAPRVLCSDQHVRCLFANGQKHTPLLPST